MSSPDERFVWQQPISQDCRPEKIRKEFLVIHLSLSLSLSLSPSLPPSPSLPLSLSYVILSWPISWSVANFQWPKRWKFHDLSWILVYRPAQKVMKMLELLPSQPVKLPWKSCFKQTVHLDICLVFGSKDGCSIRYRAQASEAGHHWCRGKKGMSQHQLQGFLGRENVSDIYLRNGRVLKTRLLILLRISCEF